MIKTLDKYLIKAFVVNYLLSLFVLISLYVVLDLFVNFDEFTKNDRPIFEVLLNIGDFYFFNLPMYFSQLSGVITLFAACGTLARLQRNNEITAVLASGTSLYRLAAPLVLAGVVMNTLLWLDYEVVLPEVAPKLVRERDDVEGVHSQGVWCVKDSQDRLFNAQKFLPSKGLIRGLVVMELSTEPTSRGRLRSVITADKAEWDGTQGGWLLTQRGVRVGLASELPRYTGDEAIVHQPLAFYPSMLSPDDLLLRQEAQGLGFLSLRQLDRLVNAGVVRPEKVAPIKHGRFTMPINNMIMLFLGMAFFLTRTPESVLNQGTKALAVTSVTFLVVFMGQMLVGSAGFSPALPAWLPIFVFGPLAVILWDNIKT